MEMPRLIRYRVATPGCIRKKKKKKETEVYNPKQVLSFLRWSLCASEPACILGGGGERPTINAPEVESETAQSACVGAEY